jgi:N-acetylglucosaminyl-diphospho-decaprenol L-rhamnosyltransferase
MTKPPVTVIIVAYNSGDYLQACVDALSGQTYSSFHAVIADNASTDGATKRLRLPDERFSVRMMGDNLGFAAANNRVVADVASEFVALLNPDTIPEPGWLGALVEAARTHPEAASFGSIQIRLDEPDIFDGVGDVWHVAGIAWRALEGQPRRPLGDAEIMGPCAAGALYRRADFEAVGGFDERFFCYCEDIDLALRLQLAGRGARRVAGAILNHAGSGTTGRVSEFTLFHGHRNRIWTFLKNTPGGWLWLWAPYHLAANLWLLWRYRSLGVSAILWRAYVAAWRGRGPFLAERAKSSRTGAYRRALRLMAFNPLSASRRTAFPPL